MKPNKTCFLPSHIVTSNNPGDWGDGKLNSAYGMKKKEKMSVTNSLY